MDKSDIDRRFDYHRPPDKATEDQARRARACCKRLAEEIDLLLADSREKSLAMTALEETMMWTNAGIARQASINAANEAATRENEQAIRRDIL